METPAAFAFQRLCDTAFALFARHHAEGDHEWMIHTSVLHLPYFDLKLDQEGRLSIAPQRRNHITQQNISYAIPGGHLSLATRRAIEDVLDTAGAIAPAVRVPDHPLQSLLRVRFRPVLATVEDNGMPQGSYTLTMPGCQAVYDAHKPDDDLSWRLHLLSQVHSLDVSRHFRVDVTVNTATSSRATVMAANPHDACIRAAAFTGALFARHVAKGEVQVLENCPLPTDDVTRSFAHVADQGGKPIF